MIWQRPIALVNARVVTEGGIAGSVRFTSRVLSIGERPKATDIVVDAANGFVLPGLINAHDHLELNHYGRLKCSERYANASEWIDDMRPRIAADRAIRSAQAKPLAERLFIGALKNVLCGVTTVAHHNPFYRELRGWMPLRVLRRYGWAHSFALQRRPAGARGEPGGDIGRRCRATPSDVPFFVHIAEGVDSAAEDELRQLAHVGALASNTVIVHGVGIDYAGWARVARAGAAVVWCPASNLFLFDQTVDVARCAGARVALATDSRLTGSRDLLDELRVADASHGAARAKLLPMVTTMAADVIRQPSLGRIREGAPADLILVPSAGSNATDALVRTTRRDVDMVVVAGRTMIAADSFEAMFRARRATPRRLVVDGVPKWCDPALATRITSCSIEEPGVAAG